MIRFHRPSTPDASTALTLPTVSMLGLDKAWQYLLRRQSCLAMSLQIPDKTFITASKSFAIRARERLTQPQLGWSGGKSSTATTGMYPS
jgi:hypothetical protein